MPSSGKALYLKASRLGDVLAKTVGCARKVMEEQSKPGETRWRKADVLHATSASVPTKHNINYLHIYVTFSGRSDKGL